MSLSEFILFTSAFVMVSITPGMCMTLALTLGLSIGVKRTRWMMAGELIGVTLVVIIACLGAASLMLNYPTLFVWGKYLGGCYLLLLAYQLWFSKGKMAIQADNTTAVFSRTQLITQGFLTAVTNPKGWAFFMSLLPPFLDDSKALSPQIALFLSIILISEFLAMHLYAYGGQTLKRLIGQQNNLTRLNRISALLMAAVAAWLAFSG